MDYATYYTNTITHDILALRLVSIVYFQYFGFREFYFMI